MATMSKNKNTNHDKMHRQSSTHWDVVTACRHQQFLAMPKKSNLRTWIYAKIRPEQSMYHTKTI